MSTLIRGSQLRLGTISRAHIDASFEAQVAQAQSDIQTIFNTMSTDAERMAAIAAVTAAWTAADGTLQGMLESMVNATRAGAGLEADGSFMLPVGQNYLTGATSLKGAISLLDAALKAEETARILDVTTLQTQITTLTQAGAADAQAAIAAETAARIAADTALQAAIDAEVAARTLADTNFQTALNDEIAARNLLNTTLQTAISEEATARTAADSAEAAARIAADQTEAAARAAADTALQQNIDAEALARATADAQLTSDLNTEIAARQAADLAESTARAAADTALDTRVLTLENNVAIQLTYDKWVNRETPSGAVDGVNALFTVLNTPYADSEMVFLNGQLLEPGVGNDYTITGKDITFTVAPLAGDRVKVSYFR